MNYTKKIEKNTAIIELSITKEEYQSFEMQAYEKDKSQFKLEGFRPGKAPKHLIEKAYGSNVFFETAVNMVLDKYYEEILTKEKDLDIIDRPDINIKSFDDKGLTLSISIALFPEITLGKYEGLEIETKKVTVTEEDISNELKKYREQSARMLDIVDSPVKNGDTTIIDFEGKIDGVAFAGGTAKDYSLEIGSHSFIDNFEDQIIGMNIGETKDIVVKFPENYHAPELKGKPATFTVALHSIKRKELPELDDDFASNCSTFETLADLKKDIERILMEQKKKEAEYDLEDKIISEIANTTVVDVPNVFVEDQIEDEIKRLESSMKYQGIDLPTYLKFLGKTLEEFKEERRPNAIENVKAQLVIQEIVKKENIKPSEEEIDKKITEYADNMKMTKEEYTKKYSNQVASLTNAVIIEKLFKLLKEKNNIKEI